MTIPKRAVCADQCVASGARPVKLPMRRRQLRGESACAPAVRRPFAVCTADEVRTIAPRPTRRAAAAARRSPAGSPFPAARDEGEGRGKERVGSVAVRVAAASVCEGRTRLSFEDRWNWHQLTEQARRVHPSALHAVGA